MNQASRARLLAAGALLALSTLAQAQYMWIDEKGIKQFSDRAPPASVPLKNILKAPRGVASAATTLATTLATAQETAPADTAAFDGASAPAKPIAAAAPTVAERDAAYRKRVKDNLEREEKEKDQRITGADRAENCARARLAKRTIDSGGRIATEDKNGERGFMSDEQRVVESKKIDRVLADCR